MRQTARGLVILLVAASAAAARLYEAPDAATLWQEDFRDLEVAEGDAPGWAFDLPRLRTEPGEAGLLVQAAPGGRMSGSMRRAVAVDLETEATPSAFPFLVLDIAQVEAGVFAGVSLADGDPVASQTICDRADRAGRYVFDLRRCLPRRVGWAGALPLVIAARGASGSTPGPVTCLSGLKLCSQAPDRLELDSTAADGVLRRGDSVTITVHLAQPAQGVAITLAAGTPRRPLTFDGTPEIALAAADATGQMWRAVVPVTEAGTALKTAGPAVLVAADISGGALPRLLTCPPFALDTTGSAPAVVGAAMPLAPTAPILDGRLDEETWHVSAPLAGFRGGDGAASTPTSFRVCRTVDTLFVAVTAEEPTMAALRAEAAERDADLTGDDSVRLTLGPTEGGPAYEFSVNSLGTICDRRIDADGLADVAWDADWAGVVERGRGAWTVEFGIPFAALELGAGSDAAWRLSIQRWRQAGGELEIASWQGPLGTDGFDRSPFALPVGEPRLEVLGAGDGIKARIDLEITNQTGAAVDLTAILRLTDDVAQPAQQTVSLAAGATSTVSWPIELPGDGTYDIAWRFFAPGQPRLVAAGRRRVGAAHRPLEAVWIGDAAGGRAAVGTAEAQAEVAIGAGQPDGLLLSGELRSGDTVVARHSLLTEGRRALLAVATANLPAGTYRLAVSLRHDDQTVAAVELALELTGGAAVTVPAEPPAPAEPTRPAEPAPVVIDSTGLCRVRGDLLLPVVWLGTPPDDVTVHAGIEAPDARPEDRLLVADLRAAVASAAADEARLALAPAVAATLGEPALLAWLLADAAGGAPAPEAVAAARAAVDAADGGHPTMVLVRDAGGTAYAGSADIVASPDPVAGGVWWHLAQPGGGVPQAVVRCRALLAIAQGARGVVLAPAGEVDAPWLDALRRELVGLAPAVLGAEITLDVPAPLVGWGRRLASGVTVVLINPGAEPIDALVAGLPAEPLECAGELVSPAGGRLALRLGPYEVQIWRSAP